MSSTINHIFKFPNQINADEVASKVLENAALCDEVAKIQESILIVKEERKFLLRTLLEYENDPDVSLSCRQNDLLLAYNGSKGKVKKRNILEDSGKV